jgi:hypothetical protein
VDLETVVLVPGSESTGDGWHYCDRKLVRSTPQYVVVASANHTHCFQVSAQAIDVTSSGRPIAPSYAENHLCTYHTFVQNLNLKNLDLFLLAVCSSN